jgi:hypothetical protein
MRKPSPSPITSFFSYFKAVIQSRVQFPKAFVGKRITLDDGEWLVLRELVLTVSAEYPAAEAIFRPRFHVKGMSPAVNEWFSWLPIPFFAGLPGFRRKLWLLDPASGDFSGYYEWQTIEDADIYAHSFAMRFMTNRSIPGSVSARVIRREDYACIPMSGL